MHISPLAQYKEGWFVGAFEPSSYRTMACEVAYKFHRQGEEWPAHFQRTSVEINYLIRGRLRVTWPGSTLAGVEHGVVIQAGEVFRIEPKEVIKPVFLEECELIVVKIPSLPGDKVLA